VVHSRSRGLGVAVDGPCDAVGLGDGVLVVWEGELPLAEDADRRLTRDATAGGVGLTGPGG